MDEATIKTGDIVKIGESEESPSFSDCYAVVLENLGEMLWVGVYTTSCKWPVRGTVPVKDCERLG